MPPFSRQDPGKGSKIKKFETKFETKLWDCSTAAKHRRKNCDVRDGQVKELRLSSPPNGNKHLTHHGVSGALMESLDFHAPPPAEVSRHPVPHPRMALAEAYRRVRTSSLPRCNGATSLHCSDSEGHVVSVTRRSYPSQPEWYQRRFTGKPGLPSPT